MLPGASPQPIDFGLRSGRLSRWVSPCTPFFGQEEFHRLEALTRQPDLAYGRIWLAEAEREAQPALSRERDFSARLVQRTSDRILAFNDELRYTLWNPAVEKVPGVPAAEVPFERFPSIMESGDDRFFRDALDGQHVGTLRATSTSRRPACGAGSPPPTRPSAMRRARWSASVGVPRRHPGRWGWRTSTWTGSSRSTTASAMRSGTRFSASSQRASPTPSARRTPCPLRRRRDRHPVRARRSPASRLTVTVSVGIVLAEHLGAVPTGSSPTLTPPCTAPRPTGEAGRSRTTRFPLS